jgi:hypothetical protein
MKIYNFFNVKRINTRNLYLIHPLLKKFKILQERFLYNNYKVFLLYANLHMLKSLK